MRNLTATSLLCAALTVCGAATAAPSVEIDHAAARVTILPEARSDIEVTVVRTNPKLPLHVSRQGDKVIVDGNLGIVPHSCHAAFGHRGVGIFGVGDFGYDDLPQLVIHVPMDVSVGAGDAVFGSIGRSGSVDLRSSGCGDWTVANVAGPLRVAISGSGDVRAGSAGSADFRISGSGDIYAQDIRGGLTTSTSGSGDIVAASIDGPFNARVSGSGDVRARTGQASDMQVSIAGSGDVTFGGVAQNLDASIAGSGDVSVRQVTGQIRKHVAGSGGVSVGG